MRLTTPRLIQQTWWASSVRYRTIVCSVPHIDKSAARQSGRARNNSHYQGVLPVEVTNTILLARIDPNVGFVFHSQLAQFAARSRNILELTLVDRGVRLVLKL